jgi:alcohol dehydrogenase
MNTFRIVAPDGVRYGPGVASDLAEFVPDDGPVLVVTDASLLGTPATAPVFAALDDTEVETFDDVTSEPKIGTVERATNAARASGASAVVGVGGGSALDTAKLAAAVAPGDGDVRDALGMGNAGHGLPVALLPTTAGTGSEVTHAAVVADEADGGNKRVAHDPDLVADLALVDPDLSATVPPRIAAATGLDTLAHAVEAYVSRDRTLYADGVARRAIELVGEHLRPAVHRNDADARAAMGLAAALGGHAFANAGLGAVHALTYPLGVEHDLGHGLANAVLLPHVVRYNAPADRDRFAAVAALLERGDGAPSPVDAGGPRSERAVAAADRIEALCADLGLPTRLRDLDAAVDRDAFERYADVCFEHSRHNLDANPRRLDRSDLVSMYRDAH